MKYALICHTHTYMKTLTRVNITKAMLFLLDQIVSENAKRNRNAINEFDTFFSIEILVLLLFC